MKTSSNFPADVYRDTVLKHIFADAKRLLLPSLMEINLAHVVMLAEQQIIRPEIASVCLHAIDSLDRDELLRTEYDGSFEDLFFLVEQRLAELCGTENAGRIHTARSRNDIDMTMYRMVLRGRLLETLHAVLALRKCLEDLAEEHRDSVMPGYTHNQPAQPTTLGHYLMGLSEILGRDTQRLLGAYARVNRSPMGACAITTTGFPINRERTAQLLGFSAVQVNSYGAIASVDYVTESCSAMAVMLLSLGRFAQDLLLWSTAEFGYLTLSEGYVQISSIMPQKRNPVPLEHVRILLSRAMSEAQAVLNSLHNTPFADMNDSEDPLQPLIDLVFTDGTRALLLLAGVLSETTFDTARMRERAEGDFLTVTELADTLVRSMGISFHDAHGVVSSAVKALDGRFDRGAMVDLVSQRMVKLTGEVPDEEELRQALDAQNFVDVRHVLGGPARSALDPQISHAKAELESDSEIVMRERESIDRAHQTLREVVDQRKRAGPKQG